MPISAGQSIAIILVTALFTFLTRAIPFFVFNPKRKIPKIVTYLGIALPPAVIAVLVVYCLKDVNLFDMNQVLPQVIAIIAVIVIHLWKKNNLLSIGGGTVLYMLLVQLVFKQ